MASIFDWSATAASNASVGNINWAEGQAPSSINDSARYEMADVAMWRDFMGGANIKRHRYNHADIRAVSFRIRARHDVRLRSGRS